MTRNPRLHSRPVTIGRNNENGQHRNCGTCDEKRHWRPCDAEDRGRNEDPHRPQPTAEALRQPLNATANLIRNSDLQLSVGQNRHEHERDPKHDGSRQDDCCEVR